MLIVLEGLDGAGKTTQISLLQNYFKSQGSNVKYLHFPRFDTPIYGDLIARFLRGDLGTVESVHPMLVALLFAEDRRSASEVLKKWLDEGNIVILDRYIYSNIAFQCAKIKDITLSKELRDWIFDLEFNKFKIPVPELNLFLDVPLNFVDSKLAAAREGEEREYLKGKQDIHEEKISFQRNVREIYLDECKKNEGLIRVDCSDERGNMLEVESVFNKIISFINIVK